MTWSEISVWDNLYSHFSYHVEWLNFENGPSILKFWEITLVHIALLATQSLPILLMNR